MFGSEKGERMRDMARKHYEAQLKELKEQMIRLGGMVEDAISGAVHAFATQNVEKAGEIAQGDDKIDAQVRLLEQLCYNLLLRQQPVAGDLREVSAVLKMLTDVERIGDHAEDLSELTILMAGRPYPEEVQFVKDMAKEATIMLAHSIDAYVEGDMDKAQGVINRDDVVDVLFDEAKASISELIKKEGTDAEQALDILMAAKYFERIGDHATNIAEWVLFSKTGILPKD